ncbi:MAG: hypothetical protein IPI35_04265 [Deltaproteobacteria bacterium]|nr:hypothetical protein [Deltaproteobacteria bacterium]
MRSTETPHSRESRPSWSFTDGNTPSSSRRVPMDTPAAIKKWKPHNIAAICGLATKAPVIPLSTVNTTMYITATRPR